MNSRIGSESTEKKVTFILLKANSRHNDKNPIAMKYAANVLLVEEFKVIKATTALEC